MNPLYSKLSQNPMMGSKEGGGVKVSVKSDISDAHKSRLDNTSSSPLGEPTQHQTRLERDRDKTSREAYVHNANTNPIEHPKTEVHISIDGNTNSQESIHQDSDGVKHFKEYLKTIRFGLPEESNEETRGKLIELRKNKARPPRCSFLGAKAVSINIHLMHQNGLIAKSIIDSGSDITLISDLIYKSLSNPPKKQMGRRINLVQVTGSTSIDGFITLPIYFDTPNGPVKIEVEAYIVNGMSTPFILGNDFADQYDLSILRSLGSTKVLLGNSNREVDADAIEDPSLKDQEGNVFIV